MNLRSQLGLVLCSASLALGCSRNESAGTSSPDPVKPVSSAALQAKAEPSQAPVPARPKAAPLISAVPSASIKPCVSLQSTGAVPLLELRGATPDERSAIAAARAELRRVLETPGEFFGSVVTTGDLILLELWHESAFSKENCGRLGNPGEKSRTLGYDVRRGRIVSTKVWQ